MKVLQQQLCLKRCSFETLFAFADVPRHEVRFWAWAYECFKLCLLSEVEQNIRAQPQLFRF
jgi:hypothetical protein